MAKKTAKPKKIQFLACLKGSTPSAKPLKFGAEGDGEVILETDAGEMAEVIKLLTMIGTTFKVTIEAE